MNTYHATPYDISASGFYFETWAEYKKRAATHRNDFGQPVEEYEIQFIDGDESDCALFNALEVNQISLLDWFKNFEGQYEDEDLIKALYLITDTGLSMHEIDKARLDDVMFFKGSIKDYAKQYLEDSGIIDAVEQAGLNPFYIDIDAYARDMEIDSALCQFVHQGTSYVVEDIA